ncbi:MAG: topology modulation protein, partial [Pseudomonadota bacterium]
EQWVIEGNYGGTMELRLPRADAVIYLDYPIPLCLFRIIKRVFQYRGRTRPDMGDDCPERLNLPFLWYVARWNSGPRLRTEAKLVGHEQKVLRFRSPRQIDDWLTRQGS